jgi:hypothetical protein
MHNVELRGPTVVVMALVPETNAVVFGLTGQRGSERIELYWCAGTGVRPKQIDAQRTPRRLPRGNDAFGDRNCSEGAAPRLGFRRCPTRHPARTGCMWISVRPPSDGEVSRLTAASTHEVGQHKIARKLPMAGVGRPRRQRVVRGRTATGLLDPILQ